MKHFWLLACCIAALFGASGCASTGSSGFWAKPFSYFSARDASCAPEPPVPPPVPPDQTAQAKQDDTKSADKPGESKPVETKTAAGESNPFRKPGDAVATSPGGTAEIQTVAKVETTAPESESGKTLTFRPEVLALIDSELRDASPEEKASWYDQLKKVDPALVPELLKVRRLSIQIAERNTQAEDTVRAAASQQPALPGMSDVVGQINPWSRPAQQPTLPTASNAGSGTGIQLLQHSETSAPNQVVHAAGAFEDPRAARRVQPVVQQVDDPGRGQLQPLGSAPTGAPSQDQPQYGRSQPAAIRTPSTNSGHSLPTTAAQANAPARAGPVGTSATPDSAANSGGSAWKADLDRVISLAEQDVAAAQPGTSAESKHTYLQKHVYLRMLYLMADHPERALTAVPGVDPADQEFLQQMFWAMSNYLDIAHIPSERDRASQTLAQLNNAIQRLREKSDLEIHNLTFCEQIQYFGSYQRFPRDEFNPGQETLLYAELQNFKSEPTGDGQYRTVLRSLLEILGPTGEVRWQQDFPATEDLCRTPRRDYFHNYQFAIPNSLPLGPHTLKLTVFDELSGKMASYTLNFVVR